MAVEAKDLPFAPALLELRGQLLRGTDRGKSRSKDKDGDAGLDGDVAAPSSSSSSDEGDAGTPAFASLTAYSRRAEAM